MASVLVTGAAGFLGRHLCAALVEGRRVIGAVRSPASIPGVAVELAVGETGLGELVLRQRPEQVIHAAFTTRKPADWPVARYLQSSIAVDAALFEACAAVGASLILVSSSAVYGSAEGLIDEDQSRNPVSLYGIAKVMQEMLAEHWQRIASLPCCIVRPFNLCGPGQGPGMLLPDWVKGAVAIARGGERVLKVYTRASSRDFVDVRDAVRAIVLIASHFRSGDKFNIAAGKAVPLSEVSEALQRLSPISYEVLETHPSLGTTDVSAQVGSFARIEAQLGWRPEIDWQTSLRDLFEEQLQAAVRPGSNGNPDGQ